MRQSIVIFSMLSSITAAADTIEFFWGGKPVARSDLAMFSLIKYCRRRNRRQTGSHDPDGQALRDRIHPRMPHEHRYYYVQLVAGRNVHDLELAL